LVNPLPPKDRNRPLANTAPIAVRPVNAVRNEARAAVRAVAAIAADADASRTRLTPAMATAKNNLKRRVRLNSRRSHRANKSNPARGTRNPSANIPDASRIERPCDQANNNRDASKRPRSPTAAICRLSCCDR
jgi:hypothetical protein